MNASVSKQRPLRVFRPSGRCFGIGALIVCLALVATQLRADICQARVDSINFQINTEILAVAADPATRRERLVGWPSSAFAYVRDTPRPCTSNEIFAFLSKLEGLDKMCLIENDEQGYLFLPGERNYRGRCRKTVCERVNDTKEGVVASAVSIAQVVSGVNDSTGISTLTQSSGAVILTGSPNFLVQALGSAGAELLTALSTPTVLPLAVVSVVGVGGAVYLCSE